MSTGPNPIPMLLRAAIALGAVVLSGCATTYDEIPAAIRQPPPGNLQLVEAMTRPQLHLGTAVRWGGTVITVRKSADGSAEIEILQRGLDDRGRPQDSSPSDGRFLIRVNDTVESNLYRPGSQVTVAGIFQRLEQHQVGESRQSLALVQVSEYIQWAEDYPYPPYDDPFYYGWPYYGGAYYGGAYYGWPYYNRPYFPRRFYYPRFRLGIGYSN